MAAIVIMALAAASCERTGKDENPDGPKGTFTAEGITATFDQAADIYAYEDGMYVHGLVFSNIDINATEDNLMLEKGQRVDAFMTLYMSLSKDIPTNDIPAFSMDGILPTLPGWMVMIAAGYEGSAIPDEPKVLYEMECQVDGEISQPAVKIEKNGDSYKVRIDGVIMYDAVQDKEIKGTLTYEGPIPSINNPEIFGDSEAAMRQLIRR